MKWPMIKLGELGSWSAGGTPPRSERKHFGGKIPWASIADLNDEIVSSTRESLTPLGIEKSSAKVYPKNSLLIAMYGSIGKLGINSVPMASSQAIACFIPNHELITLDYSKLVLQFMRPQLLNLGQGGTQKNISQKILKSLELPLPPLEEQKRIAEVLSKVDQAIELNQRELSLLEDAVKRPLFPLLPGDARVVSELVKSISSGKSIKESDDEHSGKRVLKVSAVTKGYFDSAEAKPLPANYFPPNEHKVQKGDLLFSRANTSELVGASAVVTTDPGDIYLPDKLWKITLKADADIHVFWHLMQLGKVRSQISQLATGSSGSMKNISQNSFLSVKVPTVPDEYQEQLSQTVKRMLEFRSQTQRRAAYLRELREALAMRAFSGQL